MPAWPSQPSGQARLAVSQPRDTCGTPSQQVVPDAVVMMYSATSTRGPGTIRITTFEAFFGEFHVVEVGSKQVGLLSGFGIGGPAAASVLEEAIAAGVRRVVSIGGAGGLGVGQVPGDVVVCDRAVRDEGVSHHYWSRPLRPAARGADSRVDRHAREARQPSAGRRHLDDRRGLSETRQEVLAYRAEGVLTVRWKPHPWQQWRSTEVSPSRPASSSWTRWLRRLGSRRGSPTRLRTRH
ncbi:hypothetical protein E4K10_48535 [Streptomyces sp. T1317-0309]|nr:hypothetical protein E4K10_48535 [Streptomyces sp. T1317-0309]